MSEYQKRKTSRKFGKIFWAFISIIIVTAIAAGTVTLDMFSDRLFGSKYQSSNLASSENLTTSSEPELPPEPITASLSATGDLLMHEPIFKNAYDSETEEYNFDNIFTYFASYVTKSDYAVANLETTLRGTEDGRKYSGYPAFNCPDSIVDATKTAGFDMLLTANNHSYDTSFKGFQRTLEVIDSQNIDRLGTIKDKSEIKFAVKNINGINIGMTCFTYETGNTKENCVSLNGIPLTAEASALINTFNYSKLDEFFINIENQLRGMKAMGAEATVVFIHWGDEYRLSANNNQKKIAQGLCDLGVDVIIGGHAHVVEPIELYTSTTDAEHKTVCLYSLGNAVSNQRTARASIKTGHTEYGMLFSVTFEKIGDQDVTLKSIDVLPTWVNLFNSKKTGKSVYQIIPLDKSVEDWKEAFDLTDTSLEKAEKSYERTMKIVGEGLEKVNLYLSNPDEYKSLYETESDNTYKN